MQSLWFYARSPATHLGLPAGALLAVDWGVSFRQVFPVIRDMPEDYRALAYDLADGGALIPLTRHEADALPPAVTGRRGALGLIA